MMIRVMHRFAVCGVMYRMVMMHNRAMVTGVVRRRRTVMVLRHGKSCH